MKNSMAQLSLPFPVQKAITKLGTDIGIARKRRRLTMAIVAERALVSRNTLTRVERGDPGVSLGIYASVLFVLKLSDGIAMLADPMEDELGQALEHGRLPARARSSRR